MNTKTATATQANVVNGVNVDQIHTVIDAISTDSGFGQFQFRARNRWIDGGLNRSEIKDFFAGAREDDTRTRPFSLDADEPLLVAGNDSAPNSMEYVLHALVSCMTGTLVYHAAVRGIAIAGVSSRIEGDMDVRGLLGMSDNVRKGFHHVRVTLTVDSDADVETLTECALFSPVYDIVSRSLPVEFRLEIA
ncbi:MAG: OsmC family protein [Gammaproteobacteria bacterium]